jgi:hypothetical protein
MTNRIKLAGIALVVVALAGLGSVGASRLIPGANETHTSQPTMAIKRTIPPGKPDVIKAMGNTSWADVELIG